MIHLITGVPGSGKTLFLLQYVEAIRKSTGRPVYHQHASGPGGIPDLTLTWEALDGREWFNVPEGSIVVLDEAQHVFPNRKPGSAVPDRVRHLETHRHRGFDLFFVTQRPGLIDSHVRALVGKHTHVERVFGQPKAKLIEWESRLGDPNSNSDRELAVTTRWEYPQDVYAWYKSAEVHTVVEKKPWGKIAAAYGSIAAAPLLIGWAVWSIWSNQDTSESVPPPAPVGGPILSGAAPGRLADTDFQPDLPFSPWSAPFYRSHLKVRSVPRITGCFSMVVEGEPVRCKCSTQQGTDAGLTVSQCLVVMDTGLFDPMRGDVDAKADNIRRLDAQTAASPTDYAANGSRDES